MLDGFANASALSNNVTNPLGRSESFFLEPLQTIIDLVMNMFPGEEVLKEERNQKSWNPVVNLGMGSLHEEDVSAGGARHSSPKELLLHYINKDSGPV